MLACLDIESSVQLHAVNRNHGGYGHTHQLTAWSQLVSLHLHNRFCGRNGNPDHKGLLPSVPEAAVSQWQVMVSLSAQKEEGFCQWKLIFFWLGNNVPQGKKGILVYSHYLMELFPITYPLSSLIHKLFFSKENNASEKPR